MYCTQVYKYGAGCLPDVTGTVTQVIAPSPAACIGIRINTRLPVQSLQQHSGLHVSTVDAAADYHVHARVRTVADA